MSTADNTAGTQQGGNLHKQFGQTFSFELF